MRFTDTFRLRTRSLRKTDHRRETTLRKFATLTTALVALAVPTVAHAENVKQSGYVVGDKSATVKMRVKVKDGKAVKVAGFRAKNVVARCGKDVIRIQLTVRSPIDVEGDGDFKGRIGDGEGGIVRISGTIKDHGLSAVGNVKTNEFEQGDKTCKVPTQKFKTSAGK